MSGTSAVRSSEHNLGSLVAMRQQPLEGEQHIDSFHAIRRHWVWIVVVAVLGGLLGAAYAARQPVAYTSKVDVLLQPLSGNPFSEPALVSNQRVTTAMTSEAALVNSLPVIVKVNKDLGTNLVAGSSTVQSKLVANTQTIAIAFTSSSPDLARAGASATAREFLNYRRLSAQVSINAQLTVLRGQLNNAQQKLATALAKANDGTPSADLRSEVNLDARLVALLQRDIGTLRLTSDDPGRIANEASRPTSPDGVPTWIYPLLGALIAAILTVGLVLLRERRDGVVHGSTLISLERLPILARLPRVSSRFLSGSSDADLLADAYVHARTALLARVPRGSVVAVAGVGVSGYAHFEVGANLAASIGRAGLRARFVDVQAERRTTAVDAVGHMSASPTDKLPSAASAPAAQRHAHGIDVLSAEARAELRDYIASPDLHAFLLELSADYDYLITAYPTAPTSTGIELALAGRCVILTVVDGVTTRFEVREAVERSVELGIDVLGFVFTPRPSRHRRAGARKARRAASRDSAKARRRQAEGVEYESSSVDGSAK